MLKTFSGRRASQNEYELNSFVKFLQSKGVKRYLEIGARHGDTFHYVMQKLGEGAYGVAADLPGGLWGTQKSVRSLEKANADLLDKGIQSAIILGDSQSPEMRTKIESLGPFDAILIDGDHTLAGVTRDWESYRDLAPIIAFHDIVGTGQAERVFKNPVEVPVLWEQIKESGMETVEFVDQDSKMGIGCVLR